MPETLKRKRVAILKIRGAERRRWIRWRWRWFEFEDRIPLVEDDEYGFGIRKLEGDMAIMWLDWATARRGRKVCFPEARWEDA